MDRILKGSRSTISVTLYSGELATDSSVAVTIEVLRADGTAVVSAGTATDAGTTLDGKYEFTLTPTHTANLDILTAKWTATLGGSVQVFTTNVEVVGGFYVSLAEIRAQKNLDITSNHTTAELVAARQWFEETFERYTEVSWVPRYERLTLSGDGTSSLLLPVRKPTAVRSVRDYTAATTYTSYTAGELADLGLEEWGEIHRLYGSGTFTAGNRNIVVELEHGYPYPTSDIKQAALVAIRDQILTTNSGNRVFGVQTQDGIIRTSTPGAGRPFGIPSVDAVAMARSHRVPTVA